MGVHGRVRLRSDFVEFDRLRLAPVTATLTLGQEQADLDLQDTQLCGLSSSVARVGPAPKSCFRPDRVLSTVHARQPGAPVPAHLAVRLLLNAARVRAGFAPNP